MIITEHNLEPFVEMDIATSVCNIEVVNSDHYGLEVYNTTNNFVEWRCQNGKLYVKEGDNLISVKLPTTNEYVRIFMPFSNRLQTANLKCNAGCITVNGGFNADVLTVNNDLGATTLIGVNARRLDLRNKAGKLVCSNMICNILDQRCDLGSAEFSDLRAGEMSVWSAAGNVQLRNIHAQKLDAKADLGCIDGVGLDVVTLQAKCSSGKISLSGNLQAVHAQSSLGKVSVATTRPQNEFQVELKTELGRVKLNGRNIGCHYQSPGAIPFFAKSKLGAVDVQFGI